MPCIRHAGSYNCFNGIPRCIDARVHGQSPCHLARTWKQTPTHSRTTMQSAHGAVSLLMDERTQHGEKRLDRTAKGR